MAGDSRRGGDGTLDTGQARALTREQTREAVLEALLEARCALASLVRRAHPLEVDEVRGMLQAVRRLAWDAIACRDKPTR